MRETERPQTQVGGRVRDAAEAVLNCVDRLEDQSLTKVELQQHTYRQYYTCYYYNHS